jgi:uncharacterized protein YutE (UPF0331/DUF86 family)
MDAERIKKKMLMITEYRRRIEKTLPGTNQKYCKSDFTIKNVVERNLQLISDAQFDILFLIYKGLEPKLSGDENSLLENLKGPIGSRIIEHVKNRRLFRNLLVHAYADNELDENAYNQAKNMEDIDEFNRTIKRLIEK